MTLDRMVTGYRGGTGRKFDWEIATKLAEEGLEFMLAGGLTPENVKQAVREVKPGGLDVSSGVETRGVKDAEKYGGSFLRSRMRRRECTQNASVICLQIIAIIPHANWC